MALATIRPTGDLGVYTSGWGVTPTVAAAAWRDIAFVSGTAPPDTLRLVYRVHATFATSNAYQVQFGSGVLGAFLNVVPYANDGWMYQPSQAWDNLFPEAEYAGLGVQRYPNGVVGSSLDALGWYDAYLVNGDGFVPYYANNLWDSFSYAQSPDPFAHPERLNIPDLEPYQTASFTGTLHLDIPYDENLGGYGYYLAIGARSLTSTGFAEVDGLNTLSLQSVTLTDGTPVDVTFDSGLRLGSNAVPEPSSLALLSGLGLVVAARHSRKRRLATRSAAAG